MDASSPSDFMQIGEVKVVTHQSDPTIYRNVKAGTFPRPVKFGRKSLWLRSEVEAWIAARIADRDRVAA